MSNVEAKELEKKPRLFYGWYIVTSAFLAHLSYAEQNSSVLGLFIRPMTKEMGWSRTALTGAQSVARLVEGACAPVLGPFVDRYGPRPLMIIGAVIVGFSFLGLSQIRTIWDFYMMKGFAIAVGFLFMGFMVTNTAISNWFVRLRGRAIGIAGMGTSLANIAMAPIAAWMMTRWGWRSVWAAFGVFTWAVVIIPSGLIMRRRPEDVGLKPDGDDSSPDQPPRSEDFNTASLGNTEGTEAVWSRREAMGTNAFWLIVGTLSISSFAFQGINISMVPYLEDLGYTSRTAALALSVRAVFALFAAPAWGFAVERIDVRYLGCLKFLLQGIGALLLLVTRSLPVLFGGIIVYSLGSSGSTVISEVIWANFFGRLTLGTIRGLGSLLLTVFSAIGPVFMNAVFDLVGSYQPALWLFIVLFALSAGLILLLKPPTARRFAKV